MTTDIGPILHYIDPDKRFGYAQFMNQHDQNQFNITSALQTIIIIDTSTNYFNATRLVESITDAVINLTTSKILPPIIETLESTINSSLTTINIPPEQQMKPNYDRANNCIRAKYTIAKTKNTQYYHGLYLHPQLLIWVLTIASPQLAFKLSQLTYSILIREGINKQLTLDGLIKDNEYELQDDIHEYVEVIEAIESNPDEITDILCCCDKFDIVQYNKTKAYQQSYTKTQPLYMQKQKLVKISKKQAIVIIAHYDKDYPRGHELHKLTVELIDESALPQYLDYHMVKRKVRGKVKNMTEEEYEQNLCYNTDSTTTEVITKFTSLQHVPFNFLDLFMKTYSERVDAELVNIKNNEYIITPDIDAFKNNLANYLLQYMDY